MDHGLEFRDGIRFRYHDDEPDGRTRIRMSRTEEPWPGVALRLHTVIDCTPGEERMPPVTIQFVNKSLPPASAAAGEASSPQGGGAPPAYEARQVTASRFLFSCDEFDVFSQLRPVEGMLAAAGLPRECARGVRDFCRLSAASATNMYYTSVAIMVEAGAPGSIIVDDEEEVVPDGADTGECAICYKEYVVGGATSVKLPCGHVYHRNCVDSWTRVNATCPYCRAPVPEEDCLWDDDYHPVDDIPDGEAGSRNGSRSQPSSNTWTLRAIRTRISQLFGKAAESPSS